MECCCFEVRLVEFGEVPVKVQQRRRAASDEARVGSIVWRASEEIARELAEVALR